MNIKPLQRDEVTIHVTAIQELVPIVGNVSVSGDESFDREVEDNILCRVQQGDVWAWATVTVTVDWEGQQASDHLGCCSYADEADFQQPGGYFDDMVDTALDTLNERLDRLYGRLAARLP